MALARSPTTGRHLEVANAILARALGLADQLVLAHPGERGIVIGLRLDSVPPAVRGPAVDDAHGSRSLYAAAGVTR